MDERTKRTKKTLDNVEVHHEHIDNSVLNHHRILAEATEYARNLANTRGTEANTDYMEA